MFLNKLKKVIGIFVITILLIFSYQQWSDYPPVVIEQISGVEIPFVSTEIIYSKLESTWQDQYIVIVLKISSDHMEKLLIECETNGFSHDLFGIAFLRRLCPAIQPFGSGLNLPKSSGLSAQNKHVIKFPIWK